MSRRLLSRVLAAAVLGCSLAPNALWAQARPVGYPVKPITVIVPFAAGQSGDVMARVLGEHLSRVWGQPLVVDNKAGAGGALGSRTAAAAPADGYTLLLGSSGPLAVAPNLYSNPGYNPREFTPIMNVAGVAQALVVPANSRFRTLEEFIAAVKAEPGKLSYGSGGVGSFQHLTFEMLKQRSGANVLHVPYKGSAPAYNDLFGGQLAAMFDSLPAVLPHVKSGRGRVLAVSTAERVPQLPDVPTVAESGFAGFDALGWLGIVAPKGLDPGIRERLHADLKTVLANEAVRSHLTSIGMIVLATSPDEFGRFIDAELKKWGQVIKAGGIAVE